jgi:hypothetical protein
MRIGVQASSACNVAFMKHVLPPLSSGCGEGTADTAALCSQPSRLVRMSACHQAGSGAGLAGTAGVPALLVGEGALLLAASPLAPPLGALAVATVLPALAIEAQLLGPLGFGAPGEAPGDAPGEAPGEAEGEADGEAAASAGGAAASAGGAAAAAGGAAAAAGGAAAAAGGAGSAGAAALAGESGEDGEGGETSEAGSG